MLISLPLKIEVSSECNLQCFFSFFFFFFWGAFSAKDASSVFTLFFFFFFLLFYDLNKKKGGRLLYSTSVAPFKESFLFSFLAFFPAVSGDKVLR